MKGVWGYSIYSKEQKRKHLLKESLYTNLIKRNLCLITKVPMPFHVRQRIGSLI